MDKKGQTRGFMEFGVGIAIGVVTFAVLAIMLNALFSSQTANSYAANITQDGLTFLQNLTNQFGTAGTVLGVSLLLVIVAALGIGGYSIYQRYR